MSAYLIDPYLTTSYLQGVNNMAELAEVFNILADGTTGEGEAAISRIEGEASAAIAGLIGFSFKDDSGNVVLPQLSADGRLPVQVTPAGAEIEATATVTVAALDTEEDVAVITLTASTSYAFRFGTASSFQPCLWSITQTDDASVTSIMKFVTGSGQYNYTASPLCLNVTAGATGVQELAITVTQLRGPLSDAHATLCVQEN
jgi:hypothetical protein